MLRFNDCQYGIEMCAQNNPLHNHPEKNISYMSARPSAVGRVQKNLLIYTLLCLAEYFNLFHGQQSMRVFLIILPDTSSGDTSQDIALPAICPEHWMAHQMPSKVYRCIAPFSPAILLWRPIPHSDSCPHRSRH